MESGKKAEASGCKPKGLLEKLLSLLQQPPSKVNICCEASKKANSWWEVVYKSH